MRVPTVLIQTENGPVLINESDFDKSIHKLFEEPKPTKTAKKTAAKPVKK